MTTRGGPSDPRWLPAGPLHEKRGYSVSGTTTDFPPGRERCFLTKSLG